MLAATPPPRYSEETTPLVGSRCSTRSVVEVQKTRSRITYKFVLGVGFALIAAFLGSMVTGYTTGLNSYCNPAVREALMRQREMEIRDQEDQRRQWEFEKAEWKEKRDEWRQERDEWERERRQRMEEKKRKDAIRRAHVKFEIPSPHKSCLSYGTREYSAQLLNVPDDLNALDICYETEGSIHDVMKRPDYCEDKGKWGGVYGHWKVDLQEAACKPSFSSFADKGCLNNGSGIRIYHSHLENLKGSDNWEIMCSTTPADFFQHHFDSPTHCADWGIYGIWGIWEVHDAKCQ